MTCQWHFICICAKISMLKYNKKVSLFKKSSLFYYYYWVFFVHVCVPVCVVTLQCQNLLLGTVQREPLLCSASRLPAIRAEQVSLGSQSCPNLSHLKYLSQWKACFCACVGMVSVHFSKNLSYWAQKLKTEKVRCWKCVCVCVFKLYINMATIKHWN